MCYHQPDKSLLNRPCRRRSKKTSKLCVTGLCARNSQVTGEFPAQMASNAENVSIWWRHHVTGHFQINRYLHFYVDSQICAPVIKKKQTLACLYLYWLPVFNVFEKSTTTVFLKKVFICQCCWGKKKWTPLQTAFSNSLSWMKRLIFWLKCHRNGFLHLINKKSVMV